MTEDEKFFAWLDGELPDDEAAAMEAKIAADPQLQRLAEQHRALGAELHGAFDRIAEAPVPERLQAVLRPSAQVVDLAAARRARAMPSLSQWAAMAATLAIGVFVGTMVPQRAAGPVRVEDGKLYAAASLDHALDKELASAPAGNVRIGLTFRDQAGRICRTFTTAAASGLACHDNGHWQVHGMFAAPQGQASDYRMAAGMDPNLAALVDSSLAGEPFDAAAEKAAKDRGWR
jgi:hypothetical protein